MDRDNISIQTVIGVIFVIAALAIVPAVISVLTESVDNQVTTKSLVEEASYIIYKDGDYVCAKNGTTGRIDYRLTSASQLLQSAIDNANQNGTIYLAPGQYSFDSTVYINKTLRMVGNSEGTPQRDHNVTRLSYEGSGDFIIFNTNGAQINCGLTLERLKIIGNNASGNGLNMTYATYGSINNCEITGFGDDGIIVWGGTGQKFADSVISGNGGYGIHLSKDLTVNHGEYGYLVSGCVMSSNELGNLALGEGSIMVDGCTFENGAGVNADHILINDAAGLDSNVVISGSIFASAGYTAPAFTNSAINITSARSVIISANVINANYYGVKIVSASNVVVDSNTFSNSDGYAVYNAGANDVVISQNIIKISRAYGGGIRNAGTYSVVIDSNIINGEGSYGDSPGILNSGNYITISNNQIDKLIEGINSTAAYVTISFNQLSYMERSAIKCDGNAHFIHGNDIVSPSTASANTYAAIYLANSKWSMIEGNYINCFNKGKYALQWATSGTGDKECVVTGNNFYWPATSAVYNSQTSHIMHDNYGYYTYTNGRATLASGTTTITVNHLCSATPVTIVCTPGADVGDVWITGISATQFTINVDSAPGTDVYIYWIANTQYN